MPCVSMNSRPLMTSGRLCSGFVDCNEVNIALNRHGSNAPFHLRPSTGGGMSTAVGMGGFGPCLNFNCNNGLFGGDSSCCISFSTNILF